MSTFNRSKSINQRTLGVGTPRTASFGSPRVKLTSVSHWFRWLVVIGALFPFSIAIAGGYFYLLPSLTQAFQGFGTSKFNDSMEECNLFDGNWVFDESYPLYNASECPFAEQGFNCLGNGRRDEDYLRWRWKPKRCEIPRFNVHDILERLRNKRVVFVGDSMSRTQWESLICLLMTGVEDKNSVYEVNNHNITKRIRFLSVRFDSFNFTVEFFRSVFLVQHVWMPRHVPRRVRSTLKLDKLDDISNQWVNSDILIFNTGHWWVPEKLFETLATCFVRKMLFLLRILSPLERRNDCLCQNVCCQLCIINHNAGPRILVFLMHFELESMVEKSCILKFKIHKDGACLAVFEKYNKTN
ncbi:PREDICTED: protein trichome berefringence-like 7 isoform X2 [Populus euphratica]|uniref:Protein trichome berefringence-like 7 isoform X2 n=1 Tax=Populus euphratica TaxID=75702 RepID=A0AAJ6X6W9_POPEU|nr:PREDICTED: protein trichome berefringence-like 7 isoform X2 [Populus euphratica]